MKFTPYLTKRAVKKIALTAILSVSFSSHIIAAGEDINFLLDQLDDQYPKTSRTITSFDAIVCCRESVENGKTNLSNIEFAQAVLKGDKTVSAQYHTLRSLENGGMLFIIELNENQRSMLNKLATAKDGHFLDIFKVREKKLEKILESACSQNSLDAALTALQQHTDQIFTPFAPIQNQ